MVDKVNTLNDFYCGILSTVAIIAHMRLEKIAEIHTGYLNRTKIEPVDKGSCLLIQARDVEAGLLDCAQTSLIRFNPDLSSRDIVLQCGDILFMARGTRNYAAMLSGLPEKTLAAASFFVIRSSVEKVDPGYLVWYLNQPQAQHHFSQQGGRGVHMPVVRRAVLESLEVPVPSFAVQKKIAALYQLSLDEQELTRDLLEKRSRLLDVACLQAAEREEL
ncbi:MAG: restriction endonuclease subunit S [Kiritimatiellae bacterium]|nr:restriction endonuclease subunit S [Kiritimatiellia bacterium]